MKKLTLLALFTFLLVSVFAQEDPFGYNSESLVMNSTFTATVDISPPNELEYAKAKIFLFARENFQQTPLSVETNYPVGKKPDSLDFTIQKPKSSPIVFSVTSVAEVKNDFPKVNKKVPYPLEVLSQETIEYTKPTVYIDSNDPYIIRKASEIAEGEDDSYVVLFKLASWTKSNIDYSLDSLTSDVTQKSSWVLDHREGVCDELTSLFIAMARSLGFPAKFVSGTAYTNWNDINGWGPHAWAEVYLPEYGWVPFDVTYGELGNINPTHVVLKYSIDPSEPSIKYEWSGPENVELKGRELELKTTLIEKKGKVPSTIEITSEILHDKIAPNSFNLIKTKVKNLADYYQMTEISISRPEEIVPEKETQQLLLKPNEEKEIFWIMQVRADLQQGFVYTMPIEISTSTRQKNSLSFFVTENNQLFSREDIKKIVEELSKTEESQKISLLISECTYDKKMKLGQTSKITCKMKNKGNLIIFDLNICVREECKKETLQLNQEKEVFFDFKPISAGQNVVKVSYRNMQLSQENILEFEVLDNAEIKILDLVVPNSVSYGSNISVSFKLKKTSFSMPEKINVFLSLGGLEKEWETDSFEEEHFSYEFPSQGVNSQNPSGKIIVTYESNGEKFSSQENFSTGINEINFIGKIRIFFNKILNIF